MRPRAMVLAVMTTVIACSPSTDEGDARVRLEALRARHVSVGHQASAQWLAAQPESLLALPSHADGEVRIASGVSLGVAIVGARASKRAMVDGLAMHLGAVAGGDLIRRPHRVGFEDIVAHATEPQLEELTYRIDVSNVPGVRLISGSLEFLDASGRPRLRMAPPFAVDAQGQRHPIDVSVQGCAVDRAPTLPWLREFTAPGADSCIVRLSWDLEAEAYPALIDPLFAATEDMALKRLDPKLVSIDQDRAFVIGGSGFGDTRLAEIWDPTVGSNGGWTSPGSSTFQPLRVNYLAAQGEVLLMGPDAADTALFRLSDNTFNATPTPMVQTRSLSSSTVLVDGTVLIAGGTQAGERSEIYTPGVGFAATTGAKMGIDRFGHVATLLPDGRVMVSGGWHYDANDVTNVVELYTPGSGWATVSPMQTARFGHKAVVLESGEVLVTGGAGCSQSTFMAPCASFRSTELYDPDTDVWSSGPDMAIERRDHALERLASGWIVAIAGYACDDTTWPCAMQDTAELFDPVAKAWKTLAQNLIEPRAYLGATWVGERLLLSGGDGCRPTV